MSEQMFSVPVAFRISRKTGEITMEWGLVTAAQGEAFGRRLAAAWEEVENLRREREARENQQKQQKKKGRSKQ